MEIHRGKRGARANEEEGSAGGDVREESEVKEKSGKVAAFFDLDGTLVAVPSLERRFLKMSRYRGAIPVRNYFLWLWEAAQLAPRGIGAILRANKMYLKGLATDRMETGELRGPRVLFGEGINRIAWHRRQGHVIVLVSGTLQPLAEEVARSLEALLFAERISCVIRVCATRLEETKGRWTGRIVGEAMNGKAKARAVKAIALELKLDLASCYAYGDSADDQWMLAAVGRSVAVNPGEELAWLARMRGWPILHWGRKEVSTERRGERREGGGKIGAVFPLRETEKVQAKAGSPR
jgi:HAD superfamily hydrolase (TIGR01490 family)